MATFPIQDPAHEPRSRRVHDQTSAATLVCDTDSVRIVTWNNVVIQSISHADQTWARTFGAVLRKQLRAHPKGVVSLAVLRSGLRPAAKEVRQELARTLEQTGDKVHHLLVVEDVGLVAQLLVTVIRGVIMLGGKFVNYSLPADREDAVAKALPLVRSEGPRSTSLEGGLRAALASCCEHH